MQKIIIRKATADDLIGLVSVCSQTFIEAYEGKGKHRPREMVTEYVNEKFSPEVMVKGSLND